MHSASLDSLKEKIVRPDFDKHLIPLLLYRGAVSVGAMHRWWNFAVTMMESEVETFGEAIHMSRNPDFAHLVGPHVKITMVQLRSVFGRLRDNRCVTDNIPGLSAYCKDVEGYSFSLTPISLYTNDPNHPSRGAPWRIRDYAPELKAARTAKQLAKDAARAEQAELKRKSKTSLERSNAIFYPYIIHRPKDGDAEFDLMMAVNNAVPRSLPDFLRADVCQDLLVAILAGDIRREELHGSVREYVGKVRKMHPFKYGDIALEDSISDDDEREIGSYLIPPAYARLEY